MHVGLLRYARMVEWDGKTTLQIVSLVDPFIILYYLWSNEVHLACERLRLAASLCGMPFSFRPFKIDGLFLGPDRPKIFYFVKKMKGFPSIWIIRSLDEIALLPVVVLHRSGL